MKKRIILWSFKFVIVLTVLLMAGRANSQSTSKEKK